MRCGNGNGGFVSAGFVGAEAARRSAAVPPPETLSVEREPDESGRQPAAKPEGQRRRQQFGQQEDVSQSRQEKIKRKQKSDPRRRCTAEGRRWPGDWPGHDPPEGPVAEQHSREAERRRCEVEVPAEEEAGGRRHGGAGRREDRAQHAGNDAEADPAVPAASRRRLRRIGVRAVAISSISTFTFFF